LYEGYNGGTTGTKLGTQLIAMSVTQATVYNSGDGAIATYTILTGALVRPTVYYAESNCGGTAYLYGMVANSVISLGAGTNEAIANGAVATFTPTTYNAQAGAGCQNVAGWSSGAVAMIALAAYNGGSGTSGTVPEQATLPMSIH
jgi:hypothetical protein